MRCHSNFIVFCCCIFRYNRLLLIFVTIANSMNDTRCLCNGNAMKSKWLSTPLSVVPDSFDRAALLSLFMTQMLLLCQHQVFGVCNKIDFLSPSDFFKYKIVLAVIPWGLKHMRCMQCVTKSLYQDSINSSTYQ